MKKEIVYIDMDNVLVDFRSGIDRLDFNTLAKYSDDLDNVPGIFSLMKPMYGAKEAFDILSEKFDVYILSTAPWDNPTAWMDKRLWVEEHLGENAYKRLILTHNKQLMKGDYLIDDRTANGAGTFIGKHILFGSKERGFDDWDEVLDYMMNYIEELKT